MKLHRISLENLNSLYGKHTVDFDSDLRGAPLFLIVGPTGSGKSTVMDAVSLALFARTPRLVGRSGDDPRLIMSRGTGTCLAEVVFSKQNPGQKRRFFRAAWMCRRSRDKPTGKLQTVRRTLYEIDEIGLEVKKLADDTVAKRYEQAFEDVLEGLTPEEFQRSMLLAQGQFSAFLHASVEERATILERLTSTEIYRDIGARAFVRWQETTRVVETIRARIDAIDVLSESDLEALRARLVELQTQVEAAEKAHATASAQRTWFERRGQLANDLVDATERLEKSQARWDNYKGKRQQIAESDRCAAAGEAWRKLQSLRRDSEHLTLKLRAAADQIEEQRAASQNVAEALAAANGAVESATDAMNKAAPRIVAALDIQARLDGLERDQAQAAQRGQAVARVGAALTSAQAEQEAYRVSIAAAESKSAALGDARDAAELALTELATTWKLADATPSALRGHLRERGQVIEARTEALRALGAAIAQTQQRQEALATRKAELQRHQAALPEIEAKCTATQTEIEAKQELFAAESDHLRTAQFALQFIDARRKLKTGVECPVCGSKEHPWHRRETVDSAQDSKVDPLAAEIAETERRAATQEARVRATDKALQDLRGQLSAATEQRAATRARIADTTADVARDEAAFDTAAQQQTTALNAVNAAASANAPLEPTPGAVSQALEHQRAARTALDADASTLDRAVSTRERAAKALEAHLAAHRDAQAKANALTGRIEALARDLAEREAEHAAAEAALALASAGLQTDIAALNADAADANEVTGTLSREQLVAQFRARMGFNTPAAWQDALRSTLERARAHQSKLATAQASAHARLEATQTAAAELTARRDKLVEQVALETAAVDALVVELALPDTNALAARVLSPDERSALAEDIADVTSSRDEARGRHDALRRQLDAHNDAKPPGFEPENVAMETLNAAFRDTAAALESLRNQRAEVDAEVRQQAEDRARLSDTTAALDAAERDVVLWDEMRKLIGTSGGGAFQRYAQILNLNELVEKANIRLHELAPRYALAVSTDREGNPELEFAIMDHDHGDRVRPQTTLSGGETFLVSLALALALSEYRQTQMPIETLLLDEGFGTLDADTLDIAMSALERICAVGGTQIGVISHVEALRERIGAQVVIDKLGAGRSRLRVVV